MGRLLAPSYKKLHFYIYDRTTEFQTTFQSLLASQTLTTAEGHPVIGTSTSASSSTLVHATVVTDAGLLQASSIAPAVEQLRIGAIVSPGNSFGWMEGGFDLAINLYYLSLLDSSVAEVNTRSVSAAVQMAMMHSSPYSMAYNPVQTAVRIPASFLLAHITPPQTLKQPGKPVPDLIHLPTMATPTRIARAQHERLCDSTVFNCTWNLMSVLADTHLFAHDEHHAEPTLNVMLTGLGTGVGRVPAEAAALHMFKAIYYYAKVVNMQQHAQSPQESKDIVKFIQTNLQQMPAP